MSSDFASATGQRARAGLAVAAGALLVLGIAAAFGLLVWRGIVLAQENRDERARDVARLTGVSITRTLEAVQGRVEVMVEAAAAPASGLPGLHALARETMRLSPHIRQVVVMVDGRVLLDSREPAGGAPVDIDRLGLPMRGGNLLGADVLIGLPVSGRYLPRVGEVPADDAAAAAARSVLPVAMALEASETGRAAMVVMALNPAYFRTVLAQAVLGPQGHAALIRFDGTPLVTAGAAPPGGRFPDLAGPVGEGLEAGLIGVGPTSLAGPVTAYSLSPRYPLAVVSGFSRADVLDAWLKANRASLLWSGALLLVLLLLGAVLVRELMHRLRLQSGMRLLSRAVDQAETPVLISDPRGVLVYVNPAFTRQTGWRPDEVLGRTPQFLKSGMTPASTYNDLWTTLRRGEVWTGAFINRHRSGRLIHDLSTISPIRDEGGRVTHLVATKLDITALKAAEAEREHLIVALSRANADLQRFAEVSAHHLQEPVRRLITFSGMLAGGNAPVPPERAARCLKGIHAQSSKLRDMIADIRLFLEAVEPDTDARRTDLASAWSGVRAFHERKLADLGATLTFPEEGPVPALGASHLQLVATHILDNAIKYRRPNRPLRVSVAWEVCGATVVLRVADNGLGIPDAYRRRVFEVFERLHVDRTREGTGVGLALVRRIVEVAGGSVGIEDGLDGGTAVVMVLPLAGPGNSPGGEAQDAPDRAAPDHAAPDLGAPDLGAP